MGVVVGSFFPYMHSMPTSVNTIIDRLGGAEAAAQLTGVGTEAVRKWRQAGAIPSRHWPAVIVATGLTLADLSDAPALRTSTTMPELATASQVPHGAVQSGGVPHGVPLGVSQAMVPPGATAALVLADGAVFWGTGFGAHTATRRPGR